MPERQTDKERLQEITAGIEKNIKELMQSDKYADYLKTMSRFHRYSLNNVLLIHAQKPNATHVASFNKWRDDFSRHVKRGEKGIKIIAPITYKKKVEEVKLDPDTKAPLLDKDGKAIIEEKEIQIPRFKVVSVFDVSQTDGKPLPQLASDLKGDVQHFEEFLEALRRSAPVPISIEQMSENMDGYFDTQNQSISIREGMSEVQTISAVVHEIAHSKLHNPELDAEKPEWKVVMTSSDTKQDYRTGFASQAEAEAAAAAADWHILDENEFEWGLEVEKDTAAAVKIERSRKTEEVEAESISYAVCQYYGIETGENSFGYIASWSKDKELPELKASLETINRTSNELITDIDRNFREICKERGIDLSMDKEADTTVQQDEQETNEPVQAGEETAQPVEKQDTEQETTQQETEQEAVQFAESETVPAMPEESRSIPMPDPTLSMDDMARYGYADADMLPLSKDRALELAEQDVPVYLLYGDNTEAMALDGEDILYHDGLCGVTREDWESIMDSIPERNIERRFEENPKDAYVIYQLTEDAPRETHFAGLDKLKAAPARENYEAVYTADLIPDDQPRRILENLYARFNADRPDDFTGHSLSVGDVVALKQDGKIAYHFCDSVGFQELPDFQKPENPLKNAEMALEDDYNMIDGIINNGEKQPTVAELEQQARSGAPISLLDLAEAVRREEKNGQQRSEEKPSIIARLNRAKQAQEKQNDAPHKSAEREL